MILNIILLLVLLSFESTIGLPIFFLYLSHKIISRRKTREQVFGIFIMAFFLAIFYSLSWPLLALLIFAFHLIWQKLPRTKFFWKLLSFILLNIFIFFLGNLQQNYFYLIHFLAFALYFYKTNLKNYAS